MSRRRSSGNRRHSHSGSNSRRYSHRNSTTERSHSVRTPAGDNAATAAQSRSRHQAHPQIETDLPNAQLKAYNVQDLSRALVATAEGAPARFATRLDNLQLDMLRAPLPADLSSTSIADLKEYLDKWVVILDTVFFFGKLIRQHLQGGFSLYSKPNSGRGIYVPERKNVRINTWQGDRDPATLAEELICTTFHLMLAAFFDLFGCDCASCVRNNDPNRGGLGTGRGPPWIEAVIPLQAELQKEVPWRVDLSISDAAKFEMKKSRWTPSQAQLDAWGVQRLEGRPQRIRQDPVRPRQAVEEDSGDEVEGEESDEDEDGDGNADTADSDDSDHYHRTGVRERPHIVCCVVQ